MLNKTILEDKAMVVALTYKLIKKVLTREYGSVYKLAKQIEELKKKVYK